VCEFVIHSDDDGPSGKENQYLILACDGLWEMMTDQEAVDMSSFFVANRTVEAAAKRLRDIAYARGSTDNISVSVVKLPSRTCSS
jgi:protein phosphatase 1L